MSKNIFLYDFNGSVQRNKLQDAVLKDMAQKDEFMKRLMEERKERQTHAERKSAAIKIQAAFRSYRTRKSFHSFLRQKFDSSAKSSSLEALNAQIGRMAFFFRPAMDLERTLSLCADAVTLAEQCSRQLVPHRRRQLLRFTVAVLPLIRRGTPYAAALRCLELYISDEDCLYVVTIIRYFHSILSLFANNFDLPEPLRIEQRLPPRADAILRFLLLPIRVSTLSKTQLICELFASLCTSSYETHVVCYVTPFLGRLVRDGEIWLGDIIRSLNSEFLHLEELGPSHSPLFAHNLATVASSASVENLSVDDQNLLLRVLAGAVQYVNRDEEPLPKYVIREDSDSGDEDEEPTLVPSTSTEPSKPGTTEFYVDGLTQLLTSSSMRQLFLESALHSDSSCASFASIAYFLHMHASSSFVSCFGLLSSHRMFVTRIWHYVLSVTSKSAFGTRKAIISSLERGESLSESEERALIPSLSLFIAFFSNILRTVDDDDFSNGGTASSVVPFKLNQIAKIAEHFRDLTLGLIDVAFPVPTAVSVSKFTPSSIKSSRWSELFRNVASLTKVLHERDSRLHFMPEGFWSNHKKQVVISTSFWRTPQRRRVRRRPFEFMRLMLKDDEDLGVEPPSPDELRNISILRSIPFVIPFMQRVEMFNELVARDRGQSGGDPFSRDAHRIIVHRSTIYEDAFNALSPHKAPDLRRPIRIQMVNWVGLDEAGVDGGGIFREFLSELLQTALDPSRGFFTTTHDQLLYPNPLARFLYPDYQDHFFFIGRIVAKLIYEGLLAEIRFADFFISQWLGSSGDTLLDLEYVKSYDPLVHKNLKFLKCCSPAEVDALDLDFSVVIDNLGATEKVDLKPNGSEIKVDVENRAEYITLYVNYFLSKRLSTMISSLRAGVRNVLDPEWLRMFSSSEISILVGGVDAEIDFDDLKKFTAVHNVKSDNELRYVEAFWLIAKEMSPSDKKKLLKFITGCSRPPLMGFKALSPPMGIQLVHDFEKLPTAATCMNMLKLPLYEDIETLRRKLLFAINSGAGFELS